MNTRKQFLEHYLRMGRIRQMKTASIPHKELPIKWFGPNVNNIQSSAESEAHSIAAGNGELPWAIRNPELSRVLASMAGSAIGMGVGAYAYSKLDPGTTTRSMVRSGLIPSILGGGLGSYLADSYVQRKRLEINEDSEKVPLEVRARNAKRIKKSPDSWIPATDLFNKAKDDVYRDLKKAAAIFSDDEDLADDAQYASKQMSGQDISWAARNPTLSKALQAAVGGVAGYTISSASGGGGVSSVLSGLSMAALGAKMRDMSNQETYRLTTGRTQ